MLVVADASPLILLGRLELLHLLPRLFDRVVTPREVFQEVAGEEIALPGSRAVRRAEWLEVVDLDSEAQEALQATLRSELDLGEAAAIALARARGADLLLIDERQGRRIARSLGLEITGTIGVLLQAKRRGLIDELRPVLERLQEQGAWIKEDLLHAVLEAVGEEPEETRAEDRPLP